VPPLLNLAELRKAHLALYKDVRLSEGVSPATVRRELSPIMEALNNVDEYCDVDGYRPPKKPAIPISKSRKEAIIRASDRKELLTYLLNAEDKKKKR